MFRIDRRPDPDVPIDTIMRDGCEAVDTIEMISSKADLPPSNIVASFEPSNPTLDCIFILRICYILKQEYWSTQRYSLQKFNCYFLSWTVFMLYTRQSVSSVSFPEEIFRARLNSLMERVEPVEASTLLRGCERNLWARAVVLALNAQAGECEKVFRRALWTHRINSLRMPLKVWISGT
jgi:hypothetical protein